MTIRDVALRLGVSPSTVSRALRDHPDLNPDTKKRICDMVAKLGYRPNLIAQSLSSKSTKAIGVQVPEIKRNFFASLISGIETVAYDEGYFIITCQSTENSERQMLNLQGLIAHQVAGIIISISQDTKDYNFFKSIMESHIPIVFVDRVPDDLQVDKVVANDYGGAYKLVSYMIEQGYNKIAHLGGTEVLCLSQNRFCGYCEAMKDHGLSIRDEHVLFCGFTEQDGYAGFQKILELADRPDAIFAVNTPVAEGVYSKCAETGLSIPTDLGVAAFGDSLICNYLTPPLTSVVQPPYEMGKKAAEILMRRIKNKQEAFDPITEVFPTELSIRGSSLNNN